MKADLTQPTPITQVDTTGFKCGFELWSETKGLRPEKGLAKVVDDAVLWGIISESDGPGLLDDLDASLGGVESCDARLHCMLSDHAFMDLLQELSALDDDTWCRACARALPFDAEWPRRANPATRERTYLEVFRAYSRMKSARSGELAKLIETALPGALGNTEAGESSKGRTVRGAIEFGAEQDGFLWIVKNEAVQSAQRLRRLLAEKGNWHDFDPDFDGLRNALDERGLVPRALANLIGNFCSEKSLVSKSCSRSLTLSYEKGGKDLKIVIGSASN